LSREQIPNTFIAVDIKLLAGYDIIFTTVSLLLFDVVFHAE
jgi:hypothetical protein